MDQCYLIACVYADRQESQGEFIGRASVVNSRLRACNVPGIVETYSFLTSAFARIEFITCFDSHIIYRRFDYLANIWLVHELVHPLVPL